MKTTSHLTASDLMQTRLVRLEQDATAEEAAALLDDAGIGGAPVVDGSGRVVGILSLRDVMRRARFGPSREDESRGGSAPEPEDDDLEDLSMAEEYSATNAETLRVRDCMSPNVVAVGPHDPARVVAERMVAERIHRVLVLDGRRPLGVITTFDLARAIAEGRLRG